jgi:eukaryotic-like serine/threonine-protein kinase
MAHADRSLQDEIDERGPLTLGEAVEVLIHVSDGLLEVQDVVHRDLKPGNVFKHDGRWKVADFGIARFVEVSTSLHSR